MKGLEWAVNKILAAGLSRVHYGARLKNKKLCDAR